MKPTVTNKARGRKPATKPRGQFDKELDRDEAELAGIVASADNPFNKFLDLAQLAASLKPGYADETAAQRRRREKLAARAMQAAWDHWRQIGLAVLRRWHDV